MADSSSAVPINALVFSGGEIWNADEPDALANAALQTLAESLPGPSNLNPDSDAIEGYNVSTYVRVFEDMVGTVLKEERHLFDDEEFGLLTVFAHLTYNARFLMVKLLLRKPDTWHRLEALKYEDELGSVSAIKAAIDELCNAGPHTSDIVKEELEEQEVTDRTTHESATPSPQEQDKPASVDSKSQEPRDNKYRAVARGGQEMDLKSLLECLRVDELKGIAKHLKLKPKAKQNKNDLIRDILGASSSQSTLTDFACRDGVTESKGRIYRQSKLSFFKLKPQQDRLRAIVLSHLKRCIRVDDEFFDLMHRVNLVYFRLTQYTPGVDVAALLTRFGKRSYAGYEYKRTNNIWPSREALYEYDRLLMLESQVDALLAGNGPAGRELENKTPAPTCFPTPVTPGNPDDRGEAEGIADEDAVPDSKPVTARVRGASKVKDIFEQIYPRWQELVKTEGEEDGRTGGLERFHCGHVLTRIVCKGSAALGILKDYQRELEVLAALLAQKRWRRGQRGKWHDRRALILSKHCGKDEQTLEQALDAVIEALRDPDTRLVYRPKLRERLKKLENRLKIPVNERHISDGGLVDAEEVEFEAIRLKHRAASLKLDRTGRCIDSPQQGNQGIKHYYSPVKTLVKPEPDPSAAPPSGPKSSSDIPKGKSHWLGRDGKELTVENLALQRYEEQGFKGVHCETRIIAMIFGLLFWDIIFESIPGAFETPYQTAPLDIAEDSFYHARKDLMEQRLADIEAGKGLDLIREVDAKHRASGTWCVGVRWDLFSSEDLVDIVTCIGGQALSVICRVLCEDYTFGSSGGPDLFLWNAKELTCKFVEVKGPGDILQENQRIWIDILVKAPVAVEVCRVKDSGDDNDKKPNTRTPKSARKQTKKTPRRKREPLVDTEDGDALPITFSDPSITLEEQSGPAANARSSPGPSGPRWVAPYIEGTSNPLKRNASPPEYTSPIPLKRQRT